MTAVRIAQDDNRHIVGVWKAAGEPDWGDIYRTARVTLRVALQLGHWRAYAAGTWWTFEPWP